jgi:Zn-dependent M28 family amino/carboxypeptidase
MSRNLAALLIVSALATPALAAAGSGPIDPARMSATVKELASDPFQGRAPGTQGETVTIDYLVGRLKALGLEPAGPDGSWTQPVPLVRTQVGQPALIGVRVGGQDMPLRQGQEVYVSTVRPVDRLAIADAPMVFMGYGVNAPERGWDDFKGVDLKGKVMVVLVNDPDFDATPGEPVAGRFGGKAMTYYGRWTYKYEEGARRGAAAVLIIHDTPGAAYGWSTVIAPGGEAYDIIRAPDAQPVLMQGWISGEAAADLFKRAGLDLAEQRIKARRADFHPVGLGDARFSLDAPVSHSRIESHNVLAKITGARRPAESVMFSAHWDAYGVGAPDAQGRTIRRGANDDGMGVAGVLEIARAFKAGPPPARTVAFGFWTAEERNLLGSETYAVHPTLDLGRMAADFTLDVLQTAGPSRDIVLVGAGQNSLEGDLARVAATQGRTITPDAHPERGLFYRADHFSLAKRGVPTLLMMGLGGGADLVEGGRAAGEKWVSDYTANCYHKPCDAWSPDWNLAGAAQDVDAVYQAGRAIAESDRWPQWNAGSEFGPVRARSAAERAGATGK